MKNNVATLSPEKPDNCITNINVKHPLPQPIAKVPLHAKRLTQNLSHCQQSSPNQSERAHTSHTSMRPRPQNRLCHIFPPIRELSHPERLRNSHFPETNCPVPWPSEASSANGKRPSAIASQSVLLVPPNPAVTRREQQTGDDSAPPPANQHLQLPPSPRFTARAPVLSPGRAWGLLSTGSRGSG